MPASTKDSEMIVTKEVVKQVSPDTGAIALWLKNRKRDTWQNTNTLDEKLKKEQIKKAKAEAAILENAANKLSAGEETAKHIQSLIDIGKTLIGGEE